MALLMFLINMAGMGNGFSVPVCFIKKLPGNHPYAVQGVDVIRYSTKTSPLRGSTVRVL
jgi:hypothetical protein